MFNRWRILAAAALAGGTLVAGQAPALAASGTATPKITVQASTYAGSFLNYWFVAYKSGQDSQALIEGNVTNGTAGDVLTLYAQRFPYKKHPVVAGTTTLTSTGATPYTFTVTPTLATRYRVKLTHNGSVVAKSPVQPVYVVAGGTATWAQTCQRPVCKENVHIRVVVPRSALRREMRKRTYPYFGLRLSSADPNWLYLNGGHARVSQNTRVSATTYKLTIHYRFRIGNSSYTWLWRACTKDTEAKDGMGLPIRGACGVTKISPYLGYLG